MYFQFAPHHSCLAIQRCHGCQAVGLHLKLTRSLNGTSGILSANRTLASESDTTNPLSTFSENEAPRPVKSGVSLLLELNSSEAVTLFVQRYLSVFTLRIHPVVFCVGE